MTQDEAIAQVQNASRQEIESIRDLALQLGRDTAFSATEAAKGIEELGKAMAQLPDVLAAVCRASAASAADFERQVNAIGEVTVHGPV